MKTRIWNIVLKGLLWTLGGILLVLVACIAALYIPGTLNRIAGFVLPKVEQSAGMRISVGDISLRFPLNLSLTDATVMYSATDSMAHLADAHINVSMAPLLKGEISLQGELSDGFYQMGGVDSMYIRADIDRLNINAASMNIAFTRINIDEALLDGARVNLIMGPDSTAAPADTVSATQPLLITAGKIEMRRVYYTMSMLPVIDSLGAHIQSAILTDGTVDMAAHSIHAASMAIDSVSAAYFTPSAEYLAAHPDSAAATASAAAAEPWTVTADNVSLLRSTALYAMAGATPVPGLDMNYLQVSGVNIEIDSLYNRSTAIRVPLKRLTANERSGLRMDASGLFEMDSTAMRARNFEILTDFSSLRVDAMMGMAAPGVTTDSLPLALKATASIGVPDVKLAYPAMAPMLSALPATTPLTATADINGSMANLHLDELVVSMQRVFSASMSGRVANVTDMDRIDGQIDINGRIIDPGVLRPTLRQARLGMNVNIPPMTMNGKVRMNTGNIRGQLRAATGSGRLALDASWQGRREAYSLDARADSFPVRAFMPDMGIGSVTARVQASGHGLDIYSPATSSRFELMVDNIDYDRRTYRNILLNGTLADRTAKVELTSANRIANLTADITATIAPDVYTWDVTGDVHHLDLEAMALMDTTMQGTLKIASSGRFNIKPQEIDAVLNVENLNWYYGAAHLMTDMIQGSFRSYDSLTHVALDNRQLHMSFTSPQGLDSLMAAFTATADTLNSAMTKKQLDVNVLQHTMPEFALQINAGTDNLINDYLTPQHISFRNLAMKAANDSLIHADLLLTGLRSGQSINIDTISGDIHQHGHDLHYRLAMNNRPGTMDQFAHVDMDGRISGTSLTALASQRDIQGRTGYRIGFDAALIDSIISLRLNPYDPVIAYKNWTVNHDNFIHYSIPDKRLTANLDMAGNNSHVLLYTTAATDTTAGYDDLVLKVTDFKLSDWLALNPFAPPIQGSVNADMTVSYNHNKLNGSGSVNLDELYYGGKRVGSFDLGVDLSTDLHGAVNAEVALMVDSIKTITAVGCLNDTTKANPFDLDFTMIRMPLRVANPFLPAGTATLSGMLNGTMQITGDLANPIFNGYIDFDSAAVNVDMLGTAFRFSTDKVPVDSNVVRFTNYAISAVNSNPLLIDGTVDMTSLSEPRIDLAFNARNMQVVGGKKNRKADVYGKAFIDLDATVKGNMQFLRVDADLSVLRATDVTYKMDIMATQATALGLQNTDDMVRFVNFNDSLAVLNADSITQSGMAMMLNATLNVNQGSTINVDLSPDGNNKVQIQGVGSLDYTMSPLGDSRLTGRFTVNDGFVRYTPPLISEKLFKFTPGSYVNFTGDMLNPNLQLAATDQIRANVTRQGENSRLVNFDVNLTVTGTLENMNVAFDLSTRDDITVQNELQSMSAEQRANQAMNLMLYNVYTGPGTKGNANLSGNPLYSFLESQLNSWAANAIHGVDISFGIDQYDQTRDGASQTTTSYSYKVSKSLFNNRFKIAIGGNYSSDADPDSNLAQNLINDISLEYMLNRSGSMYVKLFRHTGYESILEGEITQTGVGFVYKRKLRRLGDMFRFLRPRRKPTVPQQTPLTNEEIKQ